MILLAPAFALFLLAAAPNGWRSLIDAARRWRSRLLCACAGALQYAWNLSALWMLPDPPARPRRGAPAFLVRRHEVGLAGDDGAASATRDGRRPCGDVRLRPAASSSGGLARCIALAGLGPARDDEPATRALLLAIYVVNLVFAFGYNVGDTHVFYLPSHLMVALLAAPGLVLAGQRPPSAPARGSARSRRATRRRGRGATIPRSTAATTIDPTRVLAALTAGLDDRHAILLTDLTGRYRTA